MKEHRSCHQPLSCQPSGTTNRITDKGHHNVDEDNRHRWKKLPWTKMADDNSQHQQTVSHDTGHVTCPQQNKPFRMLLVKTQWLKHKW